MSIAKVTPFAVEQVSYFTTYPIFDVISGSAAFCREHCLEYAMLQQEASWKDHQYSNWFNGTTCTG